MMQSEHVPNESFVDRPPIISGLLKKRGLGWLYKPWRTRKFSLISTDSLLYLTYEHPETKELRGRLSICNSSAEIVGIVEALNQKMRYIFRLQVFKCAFNEYNEVIALSGIKDLILSTSSAQERDDWIRALNDSIARFYADLPIPKASFHSCSKLNSSTVDKEILSPAETKLIRDWANLYRFFEVVKRVDSGPESDVGDINADNGKLGTPLSFALRGKNTKNDVEIVRLLLKCGADPNIPDRNCPLLRALLFAKLEIVDLLMQYGANINQRSFVPADNDWTGDTLLLVFLKSLLRIPQTLEGRRMIKAAVHLAIERGADVNMRDKQGMSGKDYMNELRMKNFPI